MIDPCCTGLAVVVTAASKDSRCGADMAKRCHEGPDVFEAFFDASDSH